MPTLTRIVMLPRVTRGVGEFLAVDHRHTFEDFSGLIVHDGGGMWVAVLEQPVHQRFGGFFEFLMLLFCHFVSSTMPNKGAAPNSRPAGQFIGLGYSGSCRCILRPSPAAVGELGRWAS